MAAMDRKFIFPLGLITFQFEALSYLKKGGNYGQILISMKKSSLKLKVDLYILYKKFHVSR